MSIERTHVPRSPVSLGNSGILVNLHVCTCGGTYESNHTQRASVSDGNGLLRRSGSPSFLPRELVCASTFLWWKSSTYAAIGQGSYFSPASVVHYLVSQFAFSVDTRTVVLLPLFQWIFRQ